MICEAAAGSDLRYLAVTRAATSAIRNLVKAGKTNQLRNQVLTGQREGMQTLEMSLTELVAAGIVRHDEAVARAAYPNEVAPPP